MNLRLEKQGRTTLVVPEGRLDFSAATGFQRELERALAAAGAAPASVVVDCADLEYVSSAGLRVFLLAAKHSKLAGLPFSICALRPAVRDVFEVSGFARLIPVHTDRAQALSAATGYPA